MTKYCTDCGATLGTVLGSCPTCKSQEGRIPLLDSSRTLRENYDLLWALYASATVLEPSQHAPKTGEHFLAVDFDGSWGTCGGKKAYPSAVVHYWDGKGEEGFYPSYGPDEIFKFTHFVAIPVPSAPLSLKSSGDTK